MGGVDRYIMEIEEHISSRVYGNNEDVFDSIGINLNCEKNALNVIKDIYREFGPGQQFRKIYTEYYTKIRSNKDSYLKGFRSETGIRYGSLDLKIKNRVKGKSGEIRPSRRRASEKYLRSELWNTPLSDYIPAINFKKYITTDIDELRFSLSEGTFESDIRDLTDVLMEDTLQQIAINYRDSDDIISAGFSGIRTDEYGGDALHALSFNPEKSMSDGNDIISNVFNRYQFDITNLLSTITMSPRFRLSDKKSFKDSGLDMDKEYCMGSFISIASRQFHNFSQSIPSPFVYIKPVIALFEDSGWVSYNQTEWIEVPGFLVDDCFSMLSDHMSREYA